MDYQLHPAALGAVFLVPCQVVDQHIKLAGAVQLKVFLYALRHLDQPIDPSRIAAALSLPAMDVSDALTYWVEAGLLRPMEATALPTEEAAVSSSAGSSVISSAADAPSSSAASPESRTPLPSPAAVSVQAPPASRRPIRPAAVKPTREDVTKRGLESPEIAFLLQEAQMKFGRGLRPNEASTLVWLHDDEGMGVALILMLIEFALSEGKLSIGYIERTALNWIGDGVSTIEQAEARIRQIQGQRTAWRRVETAMGMEHRSPSAKELQNAYKWVEEWGFSKEMLRAAYEECVDNTSKFSMAYVGRVLENWHKQGFTTPEQTAAAEKKKPPKTGKEKESYAGYDWELVQKMLDMDNKE